MRVIFLSYSNNFLKVDLLILLIDPHQHLSIQYYLCLLKSGVLKTLNFFCFS
jgi:hypothetical protein